MTSKGVSSLLRPESIAMIFCIPTVGHLSAQTGVRTKKAYCRHIANNTETMLVLLETSSEISGMLNLSVPLWENVTASFKKPEVHIVL